MGRRPSGSVVGNALVSLRLGYNSFRRAAAVSSLLCSTGHAVLATVGRKPIFEATRTCVGKKLSRTLLTYAWVCSVAEVPMLDLPSRFGVLNSLITASMRTVKGPVAEQSSAQCRSGLTLWRELRFPIMQSISHRAQGTCARVRTHRKPNRLTPNILTEVAPVRTDLR